MVNMVVVGIHQHGTCHCRLSLNIAGSTAVHKQSCECGCRLLPVCFIRVFFGNHLHERRMERLERSQGLKHLSHCFHYLPIMHGLQSEWLQGETVWKFALFPHLKDYYISLLSVMPSSVAIHSSSTYFPSELFKANNIYEFGLKLISPFLE